jgi:hypothetical protein
MRTVLFGGRQGRAPVMIFPKSCILRRPRIKPTEVYLISGPYLATKVKVSFVSCIWLTEITSFLSAFPKAVEI